MMFVQVVPNRDEDPSFREKYRIGEVMYANSSLSKVGDFVFFEKSSGIRFHEGHYYGIEDDEVLGFVTDYLYIQKHEN